MVRGVQGGSLSFEPSWQYGPGLRVSRCPRSVLYSGSSTGRGGKYDLPSSTVITSTFKVAISRLMISLKVIIPA